MTLTWDEAVANAYMTAGDAKTESRGYVQVVIVGETAIINSYDDYIFLSQRVAIGGPEGIYYVPKKDFKEIEAYGLLEEHVASHGVDEVFESLSDLLDEPVAPVSGFGWAPDRFTKLGRIKPAGRMDVTFHSDEGYPFAKFRTEHLEGLMTLLEDEVAGEA